MIDKIFDKLGEIFYLLPYLIIAAVVVFAIVTMLRTAGSNSSKTKAGLTARAVLSVLALALFGVVWYYFSPENLGEEKYATWARIIAVVSYLSAMTDIWIEKKTEG